MNTLIQNIIQKIIDRFTPSAASILADIRELEAKLVKALDKTDRQIEATAAARTAADLQLKHLNTEADAVYKLLHKVSELTK